ncbi:MAG: maleylpyruvate isomerase family mycothiol-dependent enzyme [Actinomycetes bacterium]
MTEATGLEAPPRTPRLGRDLAMRLAADEYERFIAQLRELSPGDWAQPTACPDWDVHALSCHVLGMAEFAASVPEQMRQTHAARAAGGLFIDALTALQVEKHIGRSPADIVERLTQVCPRAAAGRRRIPALARRKPLHNQPIDNTGEQTESWTLGYLTDVILTRDTWMHRSDVAIATGHVMTLTPEHDGVLVADVAVEWASRHDTPCALTLTGPAGAHWTFNGATGDQPGEHIELDAVEFCRVLSGRGTGSGPLAVRVPF